MTTRAYAVAIAAVAAAGLGYVLLSYAVTDGALLPVAARYVTDGVADTGSINIVSGVLLDYRAFDTLGEATVILAAVAAVSALFSGSTIGTDSHGAGLLVQRSVSYLAGFFWLFPVYIIANGHLSPGGGFQGGVSLAVLIVLLNVVFGTRVGSQRIGVKHLHWAESLSAAAFIAIGAVGIVQGGGFLANLSAGFPAGSPGSLISAGAIPLLNLVIGVKVASGLASIFYDLISGDRVAP